MRNVEEDKKLELVPSLFPAPLEEKHALPPMMWLPATPKLALLIVKSLLGVYGQLVIRPVEEENNPGPEQSLLLQHSEDNLAQPPLKYKHAVSHLAQLTVLLPLGVSGQLVIKHAELDLNLEHDW